MESGGEEFLGNERLFPVMRPDLGRESRQGEWEMESKVKVYLVGEWEMEIEVLRKVKV